MPVTNKRKIINDPVYGFITVPSELVYDLIEHRYFQRLRYIRQLGLTVYVYPGALHTRFHHALGAMHLMMQAIEVLRGKGVDISAEEAEAVVIAILLHDIGHGPFSHALEHSLVREISHEALSLMFMERLNDSFQGQLSLAIQIFKGNYEKSFLHDLVSSQLDMDRLDYLNRDSFFTGVEEGVVGFERIIKMLDVRDNHIAVEYKGIYSIEQFLIARRLMYWQVYLHKTVLAAEMMLVKVLQRAKELTQKGEMLFATPTLQLFLQNDYNLSDFAQKNDLLDHFAALDDTDIYAALKVWQNNSDPILSKLAYGLLYRKLLKVELEKKPSGDFRYADLLKQTAARYGISENDARYFVFRDTTSNSAYTFHDSPINIVFKNGVVKNVAEAADYLNIALLASPVVKYYMCFPSDVF